MTSKGRKIKCKPNSVALRQCFSSGILKHLVSQSAEQRNRNHLAKAFDFEVERVPVTKTHLPCNPISKLCNGDFGLMGRAHDLAECLPIILKRGAGVIPRSLPRAALARMGQIMKGVSGRGLMDTASLFFDPELSRLTTGRSTSLFAYDIAAHDANIRVAITGKRILVTGGAGSIGGATLELLFPYDPAAVHVIDLAENGLVELVRDFRSRSQPLVRGEFRLLPIDYGSTATQRLLQSEAPYDLVLHFAAHKHVRSEKDVPSVIQMLDTNVIKMNRFSKWVSEYGHGKRYFAVSTDKAANPTSLMGASKRLMEHVLFSGATHGSSVTSTRFANVAFSNGSLLQGFLFRLSRRQPLSVPKEVRRYFVSPREAAEICLLSAGVAEPGRITFPRLDQAEHLRPLVDIAVSLLQYLGLTPSFYDDEAKACSAVETELSRDHYPVLLTPLDTSGEKPYEEFVALDETPAATKFAALGALQYVPAPMPLEPLLTFLDRIATDAGMSLEKSDIARQIASVVPGFRHVETGRNLDDRI